MAAAAPPPSAPVPVATVAVARGSITLASIQQEVEALTFLAERPPLPALTDWALRCKGVEREWNYYKFKFLPLLSTPSLILGLLLTIIGIGGFITAVSKWNIPGLSFIAQYMPASIVFSLTLIRAGIHLIFSAVKLSLLVNRSRQDEQARLLEARVREKLEIGNPTLLDYDIHNSNLSLPASVRIEHTLGVDALHGKSFADREINGQSYKAAINALFAGRPIPPPALTSPPPCIKTLSSRWYSFWERRLPALGALDMVLGKFMLIAGIGALILMVKNKVPPGLEVLAQDPSLSIAFALILLGNYVSCSYTGWRMLNFSYREGKRAEIVEYLMLINAKVNRQKALQFHNWLKERLTAGGHTAAIEQLDALHTQYLSEPIPTMPASPNEKPTGVYGWFHDAGKSFIPYLSKPTILLGVLVTLLGIACLGMSISKKIPDFMHIMAKNTPLSAFFAAGLIVGGLAQIHKGATLSEKGQKKEWKGLREAVQEQLLMGTPIVLPKDLKPQEPLKDYAAIQKRVQEMIEEKRSCWQKFWLNSLKGMWVPDTVLGGFLLFCSITGLAICFGTKVSDPLKFITADPSFSIGFCVSFLGVAIDALNTGWRMYSHPDRTKEDLTSMLTLKAAREAYQRLFPAAPPSGAVAIIRG